MEDELYDSVVEAIKNNLQFKRNSQMSTRERTLKLALATFQLDAIDKLIFIDEHPIKGKTIKYVAKKSEIDTIMKQIHDAPVSGVPHTGGITKSWNHIKDQYYTGKKCDAGFYRSFVEKHINECNFCKNFSRFTNKTPVKPIRWTSPMGTVQIDLKDYSNKEHNGFK